MMQNHFTFIHCVYFTNIQQHLDTGHIALWCEIYRLPESLLTNINILFLTKIHEKYVYILLCQRVYASAFAKWVKNNVNPVESESAGLL